MTKTMSRTSGQMLTLLGGFDTNPADVACITDDAKSHELDSCERCLVGCLTFDLRNLINQLCSIARAIARETQSSWMLLKVGFVPSISHNLFTRTNI